MRSAAESEDVGCPDPAAVLERILSARSWRASARYTSSFEGLVTATGQRYRRLGATGIEVHERWR